MTHMRLAGGLRDTRRTQGPVWLLGPKSAFPSPWPWRAWPEGNEARAMICSPFGSLHIVFLFCLFILHFRVWCPTNLSCGCLHVKHTCLVAGLV